MIGPDDLEAFAEDLETADRIVDRAKRGVPSERHIMADEVMPFIRAYALVLSQLKDAAAFMQEQHKRELQGLDINRDE